jgi:hypothetical protein
LGQAARLHGTYQGEFLVCHKLRVFTFGMADDMLALVDLLIYSLITDYVKAFIIYTQYLLISQLVVLLEDEQHSYYILCLIMHNFLIH